jgi:hypothetical protein
MKYHNAHDIYLYSWINLQKCFKKYFWRLEVKISLFSGIFVWIYFEEKTAFIPSIVGGWSIKYEKI